MFELLIAILIAFIILLAVQIYALLRIRRFIGYLQKLLIEIGNRFGYFRVSTMNPSKTCQFCMYRQTYIKASLTGNHEDFIYRCKLKGKEISLNESCENFKMDPDL